MKTTSLGWRPARSFRAIWRKICKQMRRQAVRLALRGAAFNTGLQTIYGDDIFALFLKNRNVGKQPWYLFAFKKKSDPEMGEFEAFPEIADYFTEPADFIFDRSLDISLNYEHIIDDNIDRFRAIGFEDKGIINTLLQGACKTIKDKVKRNYKLAIPQFYTNKTTGETKIQLLLPLYFSSRDEAKFALVVEKVQNQYIGKTILTLEWAYMNSRRIVRPEVAWLDIKATPRKARLTAWRRICLQFFRHIARKLLAGRQPSGVVFIQSDEKSDCASAPPALCGVALKKGLDKTEIL